MMSEENQARLNSIFDKCSAKAGEVGFESREDAIKEILWLVQLVETLDTQLELLTAPEHVRGLMRRFNQLTPTRKGLILELMREMHAPPSQ